MKPIYLILLLLSSSPAFARELDLCEQSFRSGNALSESDNDIFTLLLDYRLQNRPVLQAEKLEFANLGSNKIAYNPTKPFKFEGKTIIAARVESRDSETDTEIVFFEKRDAVWFPLVDLLPLKMQDPFFTKIGSDFILGGVETYLLEDGETLGYRTVFYKGPDVRNLEKFRVGPLKMKDIRVVALPDGRVGLFTRPQRVVNGVDAKGGRVGFTILNSLEDLSIETILAAPLLNIEMSDEEWMGVNEVTYNARLQKLEVLAHIAKFEADGSRSYYALEFLLDPSTGLVSDLQIVLERRDLIQGLAGGFKREDLRNVIFSGGKIKHTDGTATYYVGAGDAEVHKITRKDPFP